jgi:kynurenine formamidase
MVIDLSHIIKEEMPVYPGNPQPRISNSASIDKNGYRETKLCIESHTGTHIDAPAHMVENGKFLNDFPVSKFNGIAAIIEIPEGIQQITRTLLSSFENQIKESDFVLFKTGWGKFWGSEKYFWNFPVTDLDTTFWLISLGLKGIGYDTISADPVDSDKFENHFLFFENDVIIIENLNFPVEMKANKGELFCFPLNFEKADGSPVRAVLKIQE